jgi:hypothetical protein
MADVFIIIPLKEGMCSDDDTEASRHYYCAVLFDGKANGLASQTDIGNKLKNRPLISTLRLYIIIHCIVPANLIQRAGFRAISNRNFTLGNGLNGQT